MTPSSTLQVRGADQLVPCERARLAQLLPAVAHAGAAARDLPAEQLVVECVAGRREFDLDAREAHAELLGDEHRQRGEDALAHLRAVAEKGDAVVGADPQPRVRLDVAGFARGLRALRAARQRERDDEAAAKRGAGLEKGAT
jgi:hypothetical protein